jgi:predicted nucleotide-binding protein (sugar kinase/HSP70/actin superfamily)
MKVGFCRELLHVEGMAALKATLDRLAPEIEWVHDSAKKVRSQLLLDGDACYPFKKMVRSALSLLPGVDALLVPRIIRLDNYLMCPNFRALPDMVRLNLERLYSAKLIPLLTPEIDAVTSGPVDFLAADIFKQLFGKSSTASPVVEKAGAHLTEDLRKRDISKAIALIGHAYVLPDAHLNNGVPEILHGLGHETVSTRDIAFNTLTSLAARHDYYAKTLYWRSAREVLGGFLYFTQVQRPAGMIHLVPFNCGVDALLRIELASLHNRLNHPVPFMVIVCDEHTQRDHVLTRVEAFLDMVHGITLH